MASQGRGTQNIQQGLIFQVPDWLNRLAAVTLANGASGDDGPSSGTVDSQLIGNELLVLHVAVSSDEACLQQKLVT